MRKFLIGIVVASQLLSAPLSYAQTKTPTNEFVRTANYFLMSGPVLDKGLSVLSTFDLIVIPVEAQLYNKSFFDQIRTQNPDIVILAYMPTVSWNDLYWNDSLHKSLYAGIQSDWWLKDAGGQQVSIWPGTRALNVTSSWADYLSQFVKDNVLSTGLWDGVFYDEVSYRPDWNPGFVHIAKTTRELVGDKPVIITNGSSDDALAPHVNGRMFESFPSTTASLRDWKNNTLDYLQEQKEVAYDPINIINVNTDNTGLQNDFQKMRFGITTTLLGNGYFGFDYGTEDHAQLWTYDEYNAYLGAPKTSLQSTLNPQQTALTTGVWEREFEQGKVIVNATEEEQTIQLDGDFEKLHGSQDPLVNNGSIVSEITLKSKDGIILLRPIDAINNATFVNGSFARVFDANGKTKRTGFFAYEKSVRGGSQVVHFDLNHDGTLETISADATYVSISHNNGTLLAKFAPYTDSFKSGVNISVGDLENDGSVEIVTGTENGGGPQVRVFNSDGVLINPGFFAYSKDFRGGVNVTIGDLNGDNIKEIITGAGFQGGPHVRMFKKNGTLINPGFFAFDPAFRGGVNVASADVDGDGIDEVITAPGLGGKSITKIFNRDGHLKSEFTIFETNSRQGMEITASDLDNDGKAEIIGLSTDVFTLSGF